MDHIHRASFNPILQNSYEDYQDHLEEECKRILGSNEQVQIGEFEQYLTDFPYVLKLILSLYYTLSKKMYYNQPQNFPHINNPLTTPLKYSLLKLLASIIQKKAFISANSQKLYQQISYSLVFKASLFPFIFSLLSENTNYVHLQKLVAFYKILSSNQYLQFLPINVYHLYGGGLFTIQSKVFKQKLTHMIDSIGKALSTSETIINRNIQQFKGNKERGKFLQESVKTVMMSKNKQASADVVNYIAGSIFTSKDYLQREEFLAQIQSKPIEPTLTIFLLLARSEALLFEERPFRNQLLVRSEITKTNFYTNEMTKLFNKCPFNGDERCNCKKCQCVRRNRESAKLNQEKKRNAVEQVQSFKKRIAELQERDRLQQKKISQLQEREKGQRKRNLQLQEQNLMLKSLLKEMRANPNMKMLMLQTIEPVSKVLNNDLQ